MQSTFFRHYASGSAVTAFGNKKELQEVLAEALPELTTMLAASKVVNLLVISGDGCMHFMNKALSESLMLESDALLGQNFLDYLTAPDADMIGRCLSGTDPLPEDGFLLNLVAKDQIPYTLRCRIIPANGQFLLIAEPPHGENNSLQEELLQLNNQLAVLSRESVRKSRELAGALADLKTAQSMLVHQEKMASLGQMTAGIAHEINNPLAFVMSNEHVLRRDFADLLSFISYFANVLPELAATAPGVHAGIVAKIEEIGLDYLTESVSRKISANIEGLERVKKIVLDLRNFSRLDETEQKLSDPTEGVESAIRFLGPLLKEHGVTIETEFSHREPLLCLPGPLNQAISNVLINAIQASRPGESVRVVTREESGFYCIEVTDKGVGISAKDLPRVFDPFFTTKPVGSGTGLGLSIAHQVVEAHQGKVEIESLSGIGTTVRMLLPLKPSKEQRHD